MPRQQRRRRRRGPAEFPGPRKSRLPFPINLIFNVKAFYVVFILVMIASMAAVGLGISQGSPNPDPPIIIDRTPAPSETPAVPVFEAPLKVIDTTQEHTAVLKTSEGDITIELATDAPEAVNSFAFLAAKNFYDGDAFFYVDDYFAQTGDPTCRVDSTVECGGLGGPGYTLPVEDSSLSHVQWAVVAPLASEVDQRVSGSQFRILFQPRELLDGSETVFGMVTDGQDILENLEDLTICTALTAPVEGCQADISNALIIEDVQIDP